MEDGSFSAIFGFFSNRFPARRFRPHIRFSHPLFETGEGSPPIYAHLNLCPPSPILSCIRVLRRRTTAVVRISIPPRSTARRAGAPPRLLRRRDRRRRIVGIRREEDEGESQDGSPHAGIAHHHPQAFDGERRDQGQVHDDVQPAGERQKVHEGEDFDAGGREGSSDRRGDARSVEGGRATDGEGWKLRARFIPGGRAVTSSVLHGVESIERSRCRRRESASATTTRTCQAGIVAAIVQREEELSTRWQGQSQTQIVHLLDLLVVVYSRQERRLRQ